MYDIITQWKTSKFSAFNYTFRLVCMLYFFICLSSFVCVYMHIISFNVFCPFSLTNNKLSHHSELSNIYAYMCKM